MTTLNDIEIEYVIVINGRSKLTDKIQLAPLNCNVAFFLLCALHVLLIALSLIFGMQILALGLDC